MTSKNEKPNVPGYKLLKLIGEGGMGAVYFGRRESDSLPVAIKFARVGKDGLNHFSSRLKRELDVSKTFAHPYVVKILDSGFIDSGDMYIAMEFIEGVSLFEACDRMMSIADAQRLLEHLAEALSYIHSLGVIHRDIKPSNIVVESTGRTVLLDFGLVKAPDLTAMTKTEELVGTFSYMAPETLKRKNVTAAADIYSLGSTVYWCLTGELPLEGNQLLHHCATGVDIQAVHVSDLRPELPHGLATLVMDCLSIEPKQRPQNGMELLERLNRLEGVAAEEEVEEELSVTTLEADGAAKLPLILISVTVFIILMVFIYSQGTATKKVEQTKGPVRRLELNIMRDELLALHKPNRDDCETFGRLLKNSSMDFDRSYPKEVLPEVMALVYLGDHCYKNLEHEKAVELYSTLYERHGVKSTLGMKPLISSSLASSWTQSSKRLNLQKLIEKDTFVGPIATLTKVHFDFAVARTALISRLEKLKLLRISALRVRKLLLDSGDEIELKELAPLMVDILGHIDTREARDEIVEKVEKFRNCNKLSKGDFAQVLYQAGKKLGSHHRDFTLDVSQKDQEKALVYFQEALELADASDQDFIFDVKLDLASRLGRMNKKKRASELLKTIPTAKLSKLAKCEYHIACTRLALDDFDFDLAYIHLREAKLTAVDKDKKRRVEQLYSQCKAMKAFSGMR